MPERRAGAVLRQHRSTERKPPRGRDDEAALTADVIELAKTYGRYGYRRITALLRVAGWAVNASGSSRSGGGRAESPTETTEARPAVAERRLVRAAARRAAQPRLVLCLCRGPHPRWTAIPLCVIDGFTREPLAILVKRKANSTDVLETMADLMVLRGPPTFVRSDNGREFIAATVREWIAAVGAQTAYIEPGSLRENGYCESFNSKLRDGLLNGELFFSLAEAEVLIEAWRRHFNVVRPHSAMICSSANLDRFIRPPISWANSS